MQPGDVISYLQMCTEEGASLQRGMNYQLHSTHSVILMSTRRGAPYNDCVSEDGRELIYEGHDQPKSQSVPIPKNQDQLLITHSGANTQNGYFFEAAHRYLNGGGEPNAVRVYEKIRQGIWVYNGVFRLVDAWPKSENGRTVYKFKLQITELSVLAEKREGRLEHSRIIPTAVKRAVWERDKGKCVECGSEVNLHFDHIIPFSRGGSSLIVDNIQLLCAEHNLAKSDKII